MTKKMLIDASHPEETRVVIVDGTKVEELDFESANKKQLRGNLYLARVTRVEPSLQAAFIEYGGNRHGFLAFSEIHPDYYQIPYEDRMALIEAEEAESREDEAEEEKASNATAKKAKSVEKDDDAEDGDGDETSNEDDEDVITVDAEDIADDADAEVADEQEKTAEKRRTRSYRHRYKIQEVIKRGQILLIQVVKEERGNKGAAMTTYLSLAGRYCVLMPNTPKGGGISRKIANGTDRKRLKSVVSEFEVPQGMGVIVRTAGAKRTKLEIKRDYDYLSRLWETVRAKTLSSIAPALIHEEGDLVKRSIRDLYNKDISEILVEGEDAYKSAKDFIKMLMPSHAKNVKAYKEPIPLYLRYQVENQIEDSLDSVVQLKSGGYLVIHPTEALVSIDVNSGRSTKERNVERTALKTNLEAADEVARQMRLRDLAGLIVIDFIDMDENRNNRSVEKRMKDALSRDRARVQAGRISQFGLMEISRQRRRRSLLEGSTVSCPHCQGVGRKRTVESSALKALRALEEKAARGQTTKARLTVTSDVAAFILNNKRDELNYLQNEFGMFAVVEADPDLFEPEYALTVVEKAVGKSEDPIDAIEQELKKEAREASKTNAKQANSKSNDDDSEEELPRNERNEQDNGEEKDGKKRRRRGRRGGRRRRPEKSSEDGSESGSEDNGSENTSKTDGGDEKVKSDDAAKAGDESSKNTRKPRSRSRKPKTQDAPESKSDTPEANPAATASEEKPKQSRARRKPAQAAALNSEPAKVIEVAPSKVEEKPKAKSTTRRKAPARAKPAEDTPAEKSADAKKEPKAAVKTDDKPVKAKPKPRATKKPAAAAAKNTPAKTKVAAAEVSSSGEDADSKSSKRGWWQRKGK